MKETLRTKLNDRGVSPVIGVILMVAITVILAAVIGSFVLGIGGNLDSTPQARLDITANGTSGVDIAHQGGDSLQYSNLNITINGNQISSNEPSDTLNPGEEWKNVGGSTGTVRVVHTPTGGLIAEATV